MVSAISGTFLESSLYEPRRNKRAKAISWSAHALGLLLLWLAPSALPEPPTMPGAHLPTLVFVAEPGPGGGGGGGGENEPEPPSVQKNEGDDRARLALNVEPPEEELVLEEIVEEPEDPEEEEEEPEVAVEAPVVAQAPDDFDQKGILEGPEQLLESAGPGDNGGSGNGSGTGIGPGEGSGLGPGWGGGFGGGAYRMGSGVAPPILRRQVRPDYTDQALSRKIAGLVLLEVIILKDGTVGPVRIIQSLDPGLDQKAIEAVRQWLFVPGKFRGQPVDVIAEIQVDFTLL